MAHVQIVMMAESSRPSSESKWNAASPASPTCLAERDLLLGRPVVCLIKT